MRFLDLFFLKCTSTQVLFKSGQKKIMLLKSPKRTESIFLAESPLKCRPNLTHRSADLLTSILQACKMLNKRAA